jgi:two-component system, OmpR family, sensor histidine kinase CpxA
MPMRLRVSLFSKILLWFFLNVVVLGAALLLILDLQVQIPKDSFWFGGNRLDLVAGRIGEELRGAAEADREAIVSRYAAAYRVQLVLFAANGRRLAGPAIDVPQNVMRYVAGRPGPPPPGRPAGPPRDGRRPGPPPPRAQPVFTERTGQPTRYWAGVRVPIFEPGREGPELATVLAVSDSMSGHGLYFDVRPWLLMVAAVLAVSILLWVPFVRSLTSGLRLMTQATERIAEEQFDVRVSERRSDELGRLGVAINHLAARLAAFVGGQKRFLGDIAHELNSPLGRLQVALGILEDRVGEDQRAYVADAQEDVRAMARLVSELLAYSRAGIRSQHVALAPVLLRPLVDETCDREAAGAEVVVDVAPETTVLADADLLTRALANVLRNAARYAGAAGPIRVSALRHAEDVVMRVADQGPGVPADAVGRLFDPFFRLEPDRARATGGAGLGLAIVKASVEACGGRVAARNLEPRGLEVAITLKAAGQG